jgi:hypothetical protein
MTLTQAALIHPASPPAPSTTVVSSLRTHRAQGASAVRDARWQPGLWRPTQVAQRRECGRKATYEAAAGSAGDGSCLVCTQAGWQVLQASVSRVSECAPLARDFQRKP